MADITFDTSAGSWSVGADWIGGAKPGAADAAIFDFSSGSCTLDEDSAALGTLNASMYSGTLAMGSHYIDSDGSFVWLGGTITGDSGAKIYAEGDFVTTNGMSFDTDIEIVLDSGSGSNLITTNSVALGALTVNDGGGGATFQLNGDLACGTITLASGTLDLNDKDVTLSAGSTITHNGGTLTTATDYGATIDAGGATISGVTASKWINVTNGIDGGGNTKLAGLTSLGPPVGTLGLMGAGR